MTTMCLFVLSVFCAVMAVMLFKLISAPELLVEQRTTTGRATFRRKRYTFAMFVSMMLWLFIVGKFVHVLWERLFHA